MKKITNYPIRIFTQYYPPNIGAGAQRVKGLNNTFEKNFTSQVIVINDNRGTNSLSNIVRIFNGKLKNKSSILHRIIFDFKAILKAFWFFYKTNDTTKVNVVSIPGVFLPFIALYHYKLSKIPYILDLRDFYPFVLMDLIKMNKKQYLSPLYYLLKILYMPLFINASQIFYVNHKWKDKLLSYNKQLVYLPNGIEKIDINRHLARRNKIVYLGNYGHVYDFKTLFKVLFILEKQLSQEVEMVFIGSGIQKEYIESMIPKYSKIIITNLGPIDHGKLGAYMKDAKIGIVSLNNNISSLDGAVPNKVYDYLSYGLEVIALMNSNFPTDIINTNIVYNFSLDSLDEVTKKILSILNNVPSKLNNKNLTLLMRSNVNNKIIPVMNRILSD